MNTGLKLLLVVLWIAALGAGTVGVYLRLTTGHELAGYGSYITWGLWVASYAYLSGLSAGGFLLASLVYVFHVRRLEPIGKLALFTSLVGLVGALFSIWFDLGYMGRFWQVYTQPNPRSMMAWMIWLYTGFAIVLVLVLWRALRADLAAWSQRKDVRGALARVLAFGATEVSPAALARDRRWLELLSIPGIFLVVAFNGGVGALFGVVGARAFWNATLYPLLFIVAALLTAAAVLTFLVAAFWPRRGSAEQQDLLHVLARISLGLLAFYLLLLWSEFSITLYARIPAESAPYYQVLGGPYPWVFWGFQVALGAVVPIILLLARPRSAGAAGVAGICMAIGLLATRLNVVIPGFVAPLLPGLEEAFSSSRLTYQYFPSLLEWLVFLFVVALATGLFYLGYVSLPIANPREEVRSHG
ncbi:MAG: polysulfide reductase NrfD [Chloroflexi bacterium]|nr:polysulfide reductase NrfD [Chloroflexota bacterium]